VDDNIPDPTEETYQEGTSPVQVFSSPVVPGAETPNRIRLGRPLRVAPATPQESKERAGDA
jgi:hypothetical protein